MRLLAGALLIAIGSTAATAWLVSRTTATALRDADARSLTTDAQIYDTLVGYAATHRDWGGAGPLTARLQRTTGRRIVLTDRARRPLAGTRSDGPLPAVASAVIDPLHVERQLGGRDGSAIDRRAIAPLRRAAVARARARDGTPAEPACTVPAEQRPIPADAPSLPATPGPVTAADCRWDRRDQPTAVERRALTQLDRAANACLARRHDPRRVRIGLDLSTDALPPAARSCVETARRRQLAPYVARRRCCSSPSPAAAHACSTSPARTAGGWRCSRPRCWR